MPKEAVKDLLKFIKTFPKQTQDNALWLREFVWDLYPKCNELIYDNYNAVAWGWSVTDKQSHTFCTMAIGRSSYNLHFGFYYGSQLSDPRKILLGEGNQYRYILIKEKKDFPKTYMKKLLQEAHVNVLAKIKDLKETPTGKTIVKSISAKKRAKKSN